MELYGNEKKMIPQCIIYKEWTAGICREGGCGGQATESKTMEATVAQEKSFLLPFHHLVITVFGRKHGLWI